jgi:hypothetical protein
MRRLIALAMVALLALAMAISVVGCSAPKEEPAATPPSSEMPPAETMTTDSTMMADTSMSH